MRVIAISGKASSGKDTFAALLQKELGSTEIFPFAEELKKIACQLWDIDPALMATYDGKAALRKKLIKLGAAIRKIDHNTWVDIVIRKIKDSKANFFVIPDLRFRNELHRLLEIFEDKLSLVRLYASEQVRLDRMGIARAKEYIGEGIAGDPSETSFDFLDEGHSGPEQDLIKQFSSSINNDFTSIEKLTVSTKEWIDSPDEIMDMSSLLVAASSIV